MTAINKEETETKYSDLSKRGPIQRRILFITLSGVVLVCLLIGIISYYIFTNYLKDSMVNTAATSLSNLAETIDSNVESVYRMARYCQGSADISTYIEASPEPGSVLSVATYDRLYEEYQNNEVTSYIPRVVVIAGSHFLQACSTTYSTTTDLAAAIPELDFFDTLLNASTYDYSVGIISDPFLPRTTKLVVPIVRPISYKFNSNQSGFLYMEFSADLFLYQMNHYYIEEGSSLYLTMGEHIYLYENGTLTELDGDAFSLSELAENAKGTDTYVTEMQVRGDKQTVIAIPLVMDGCYLVQNISPSTLRSQRRSFIFMFAALLASVILIGVTMALSLDHFFRKPLAEIRRKIRLTAEGDFSREPAIEWPHELGEIDRGINDLSESVNRLLDERLLDEKQKRDLEYQMLQSQINPHFLYNTLNSIKMMATVQGATGISEMTTALATLLRSISKGTSLLVPISEELSLVKNYFTIQNYRYGGMIRFNINVKDEAILNSSILKFTLQPLVENAIFHGLEPKGGTGNIDINLFFRYPENKESDIVIEVLDDGVGISKERIAEIMNSNSTGRADFFKEIGISNVHARLKYEFGDEYGISIESEEGHFTKMIVLVPQRTVSGENNE